MLTRLNQNSIWSFAGGAIPALAALASIPVFIYLLGVERFAILSLLLSLNLFFFVYDFGLARAMHFFVPKDKYQCPQQVKILTSTSLAIAFVIGSATSLFIFLLSPYLVDYWLHVSKAETKEIILAFQIAGFGVLPAVMMSVLRGRFEGAGAFKEANLAKIFSGTSLFLLPILVSFNQDSIVLLACAITFSRYLSFVIYIKLTRIINFKSWVHVDLSLVSKIKNYAFWAAISGFFSTAFIYADRFFVAGFVSQAELSVYIASQDIMSRYLIIPWSIAIVLTPYFASEKFSSIDFKNIHFTSLKKITILTLLFALAVVSIIYGILPFLLNVEFLGLVSNISLILLLGVIFASIAQLPLVFLYAQGKARLLSLIFMSEGILYLCFAPFIYGKFGVYGAAAVWSTRLFIEMTMLYLVAHRMMRN